MGRSAIAQGQTVGVSVAVTSTGEPARAEVVRLYISDEVASDTPAIMNLRWFEQIEPEPDESRRVTSALGPGDPQFWGMDLEPVFEPPGTFTVFAAGSPTDTKQTQFTMEEP